MGKTKPRMPKGREIKKIERRMVGMAASGAANS
jgi:hypothetical protein